MPVNLHAPDPAALHAVRGVRLGTAMAGVRKPGRRDVLVVTLDEGTRVSGVFTGDRGSSVAGMTVFSSLAVRCSGTISSSGYMSKYSCGTTQPRCGL